MIAFALANLCRRLADRLDRWQDPHTRHVVDLIIAAWVDAPLPFRRYKESPRA